MSTHEVHFLADYDYTPSSNRTVTYAYKRGTRCIVDDECESIVIARGIAVYADFAEDDLFDRTQMVESQKDYEEVEQLYHDLAVEEDREAKDFE